MDEKQLERRSLLRAIAAVVIYYLGASITLGVLMASAVKHNKPDAIPAIVVMAMLWPVTVVAFIAGGITWWLIN